MLQASYYSVKYFTKPILVHLHRPDYLAAEDLSAGGAPQTAAHAGVRIQAASAGFGFLKARLGLSPRCCSGRSLVVLELADNDQPFSTHNCTRFNMIGAFVSRPPFNVLRLRVARSHETTGPEMSGLLSDRYSRMRRLALQPRHCNRPG